MEAKISGITKARRSAWIAAVRRKAKYLLTNYSSFRVCSLHFHSGKYTGVCTGHVEQECGDGYGKPFFFIICACLIFNEYLKLLKKAGLVLYAVVKFGHELLQNAPVKKKLFRCSVCF